MTDRTHPTDKENPMSKTDRHDELKALLSKISEESVTTSNVLADMLDLLRERMPEREGVKDEPDERISAWHRVADHPFFRGCYAEERPLIDAMLDRLTLAATAAGTVHRHGTAQAQGRDCSERTDGHGHMRGVCMASAPADDLPGEPVEPGDLRAGDRVEFAWEKTGEDIACTLVNFHDGSALYSDVPDSGGYRPNVVWNGVWCHGISDVRLIERAPREDEDPDEALARVIFGDAFGSHEGLRLAQLDVARVAREHIEAEQESRERTAVDEWDDMLARAKKAERALDNATQRVLALTAERDKWNTLAHEADRNAKRHHDRAIKAETERDEWREVAARFENGRDRWQAKWRESDEARERAEADLADERDRASEG